MLVVVSPSSGGLEDATPCRVGYRSRRRCSTALSCSEGGCKLEVVGGTAAVGGTQHLAKCAAPHLCWLVFFGVGKGVADDAHHGGNRSCFIVSE